MFQDSEIDINNFTLFTNVPQSLIRIEKDKYGSFSCWPLKIAENVYDKFDTWLKKYIIGSGIWPEDNN